MSRVSGFQPFQLSLRLLSEVPSEVHSFVIWPWGLGQVECCLRGAQAGGSGLSPCQLMHSLTLKGENKEQSFLAALSFCARLQLDPERGHQVELM